MDNDNNIVRPIHWSKMLRADEAQRVIRERALFSNNVIISVHAFERVDIRTILVADVFDILQTGYAEPMPIKNKHGEWEVIMTRRLKGCREAGVVTIILKESEKLFIKTVEWMDI